RVLRFPEDITLMLAPGAVLVLGLAANIEIAGRIDAPLGQIFRRTGNTDLPPRDPPGGSSSSRVSVDLSGRVLFTGPGVKEVHPEWWGARSVGLAVQTPGFVPPQQPGLAPVSAGFLAQQVQDDTVALQDAIDAAYTDRVLPRFDYINQRLLPG